MSRQEKGRAPRVRESEREVNDTGGIFRGSLEILARTTRTSLRCRARKREAKAVNNKEWGEIIIKKGFGKREHEEEEVDRKPRSKAIVCLQKDGDNAVVGPAGCFVGTTWTREPFRVT